MKQSILLLLAAVLALTLSSCAQNPDSSSSFNSSSGGSSKNFITFLLRLNDGGRISPGGYYVILLNSNVQAIEVTNPGTYTDAIRLSLDGNMVASYYWLHRIPSVPGPGYDFVLTARLDEYAQISSDYRSVAYTFKLNDSSVIFNQYISNRFTATAMTTDTYQNALLGRALDVMGPGPDISQNVEYTTFFDKTTGILDPQPANYPQDSLFDWSTKGDLSSDFPYINFDIESLQINLQ